MKSDNKYFTAAVLLREVEERVKSAREHLENGLEIQAMSLIRVAIQKLADASEDLFNQSKH